MCLHTGGVRRVPHLYWGIDQHVIFWLGICPYSEVIKNTLAPLWYSPTYCLFMLRCLLNWLTIGHVSLCAASQDEKADAKTMQIRKSRSPCVREGDRKGENPLLNWIGAVCHYKKAAASWLHNSEWCLASPSKRLAIVHTWTHTKRFQLSPTDMEDPKNSL